jgi:hypothetical protein
MTYIIDEVRKGNTPFKMALFFCGGMPVDPAALGGDTITPISPRDFDVRQALMPTIHVYGANDPWKDKFGRELSELCQGNSDAAIVHNGGHEIPGRQMAHVVAQVVSAVQKLTERFEAEREVGRISGQKRLEL